ncbi:asparagine--tRNA ligase [Legionella gresilensis]|uniref:asparagine--tRNA ligase n=1 Tax=Legionella gresilensis TaxID=91823 RepID=UPI001040F595|nr:asparagine--tRNA ligase [Legionella gresilensis]
MTDVYTVKQCLEGEISVDETVTVQGWVKTRRDSKAGLSFINLHDGSCFSPIQLVVPAQLSNYQEDVLKITTGCSLKGTGKLVASHGKGQAFEIQVESLEVIGWVDDPERYPIQAKKHTLEFLREVAHLRPRTNTISAVTRIRHTLSQAIHRFFHERGFFWIHTPIITASDCEGAGELFRVSTLDLINLPKNEKGDIDFSKDFFGRETFLTVSGQLNVEAYCLAMSKVYTFGPTFRAENSNTSRHLAEFWMIEPEIAFADLQTICDLSQEMLRFLSKTVLEERQDDMGFFNQFVAPGCIERLENIIESEFEVMTYTDAITQLEKAKKSFEYPVRWGLDLQSEHERYLAEDLCKKPVIITDYPKDIKGFYMRLNEDGRTVAAMDVLAPGIGEIIGGSQREERLEILDKRMDESHLDKDHYQWYRDLRRYGSVPHAGFGLGFERLITYVTGIANVRDAIPFPRTPGHADF